MTFRHLQFLLAAAMLAIGIAILCCGCASERFDQRYEVQGFTLHVADWRTIGKAWDDACKRNDFLAARHPWGFCDPYRRILWVNAAAPDIGTTDQRTLGHEVLHLTELAGPFYHEVPVP